MALQLTMPKMSQTTEEVLLLQWKVGVGDVVRKGDPLCEVETDKTTMDVECLEAGTVLQLLAREQETVSAGTVIAVIGQPGEHLPAPEQQAARVEQRGESSAPGSAHGPRGSLGRGRGEDGIAATPLVRNIARKRGVDLAGVRGSGPRGLITKSDVEAYLAGRADGEEGAASTRALTKQQGALARNLGRWWATTPHYHLTVTVAADGLLARRAAARHPDGSLVSLNALFVRCVARALARHPRVNASYRDGVIVEHHRVCVGLAVAAGDELSVPVVQDADRRDLLDIDRQIGWLVAKARNHRLEPGDQAGGTFTVTNLGMEGIDEVSPVVSPGQAGILGVGRIRKALDVDDEGRMAVRSVCVLTAGFDHRAVNGAQAARFLTAVQGELEGGEDHG